MPGSLVLTEEQSVSAAPIPALAGPTSLPGRRAIAGVLVENPD